MKRHPRARWSSLVWVLLLAPALAGADDEDALLSPRTVYNDGLQALTAASFDDAQHRFEEARDRAGPDRELRFRAAFNLAMTHASRAESMGDVSGLPPEEAEKVLEELRFSAAWFRDAARQRPDDEDARFNLELVLRRIQAISDLLNRAQNKLELRLDRLIEEQRSLREQVRTLLARVSQAGADAEPLAFRDAFRAAASQERTLLSDLNAVSELAGEEMGHLEGKAEEERSDEDKLRLVQLQALDHYLSRARGSMSDTRRLLRLLDANAAHRKSDSALRELKRAREQLRDPITLLRELLGNEVESLRLTQVLLQLQNGPITLDDDTQVAAPPWLEAAYLGDLERYNQERSAELAMRFDAVLQSEVGSKSLADPQQARSIEDLRRAAPYLSTAVQAQLSAIEALDKSELAQASQQQQLAVEALAQAVESFADIRQLIELAYAEQRQLSALLIDSPGSDENEPFAQLSDAERARLVNEGLRKNTERLERLEALFQEELNKLASAGQAPDPAQPQQADPQQEMQRYQEAETLRAQAATALSDLSQSYAQMAQLRLAIANAPEPPAPDPNAAPVDPADPNAASQPPAPDPNELALAAAAAGILSNAPLAEQRIEELRLLFLSAIEHLQELIRRQADTMDATASVNAQVPDTNQEERMRQAGPLGEQQRQHELVAGELSRVFREQADSLSANPQLAPQQGEAQEQAQRMGAAADEIDAGASEMRAAFGSLNTSPVELAEAVGQQENALRHLQNALELLQPPQQQQQQQQQQEQVSKEQAERKLQAVRDRAAERQRDKQQRQRVQQEPVDKDW